jgi:hypothetical protein
MKTGLKKGITRGEVENNTMINRAIENIRGRVYRKYRLYEKGID